MQGGNGNEHKKGLWTVEEDRILMDYVGVHGKGKWNHIAKVTGLKRCGKSCRLRWINYLSPSVKRDDFSEEEDDLIIRLHKLLGNRWSLIAGRVPGRTDNQVKNHWNTHLSRKVGVKSKNVRINKGKCKANAACSRFSEELGVNSNVRLSSNDAPPPSGNDGVERQNVMEGNSEIATTVVLPSLQGPWMNNNYDNSFWFTNEDSYLFASNLMESFDDSIDFVWHAL